MDLEQFWNGIPPVTKAYTTLAMAISFAITFEIASGYSFYLNLSLVVNEQQWWRVITMFLPCMPFSWNYFLHMHMFYMYSRQLEEHFYLGQTAQYLYFLLVTMAMLFGVAVYQSSFFVASEFLSVLIYVWSKRFPDEHLAVFGLIPIRSVYMPAFMLSFAYFMGSVEQAKKDLLAMALGHCLWYLGDVFPQLTGWNPVHPQWVAAMFPRERIVVD